jgi:predicted nucleic acid-binding Zn ribbon protein
VIGPVGVVFKGSGFYSTDNRSTYGLSTPKKEEDSSSEKSESTSKTESANAESSSSAKKD